MSEKVKAPDLNDRLKAGTLSEDPAEGTAVVGRGPRLLTVQQILVDSHKRASSKKKRGVITTGISKIDWLTGGIQPGHGWILAAETNWGKSALALAIADVNLGLGKTVLIAACEDDESIYGDRLLARRSGVELTRIRDHLLDSTDHAKIAATLAKAEKKPIYLDARDLREDLLCQQLTLLVPEFEVALVIVDYLQVIPPCQNYQDQRVRFRETAQRITHCCKAMKVPVIVCSQVTPDDSGKIPGKYTVRESKDVVNAAEAVLIGFEAQSEYTNSEGRVIPAGTRCINVDKAKTGIKGIVPLKWNSVTATFEPEYPVSKEDSYLDEFAEPPMRDWYEAEQAAQEDEWPPYGA